MRTELQSIWTPTDLYRFGAWPPLVAEGKAREASRPVLRFITGQPLRKGRLGDTVKGES